MNKWQPFAQPVATLVLAGAVLFLGYQQGQKGPASATRVIFPSDVSVSITDMPKIDGDVFVDGEVDVDNPWGGVGTKSFKVTGCDGY